jgi:hypothetical protein
MVFRLLNFSRRKNHIFCQLLYQGQGHQTWKQQVYGPQLFGLSLQSFYHNLNQIASGALTNARFPSFEPQRTQLAWWCVYNVVLWWYQLHLRAKSIFVPGMHTSHPIWVSDLHVIGTNEIFCLLLWFEYILPLWLISSFCFWLSKLVCKQVGVGFVFVADFGQQVLLQLFLVILWFHWFQTSLDCL